MKNEKHFFELSLRPYNGKMFVARSREGYEKAHEIIFREPDRLNCNQAGRFSAGGGKDGMWTYLVWAKDAHTMSHEVCHAVLHLFERCGIDPIAAGGEPFCYMQSQLLLEAMEGIRKTPKPKNT